MGKGRRAGHPRALRLRGQGPREELGLTQEDLAGRAGIHRTYLSDIERAAAMSASSTSSASRLREASISELFRLVERP